MYVTGDVYAALHRGEVGSVTSWFSSCADATASTVVAATAMSVELADASVSTLVAHTALPPVLADTLAALTLPAEIECCPSAGVVCVCSRLSCMASAMRPPQSGTVLGNAENRTIK